MPDRSLIITSFKYGLDSRRQDLAAQPGTLVQCTNAHINPGGEVEKRNAFVPDLHLLPSNTFGIQDVASGAVCFGSDPAPNGPLPAQVTYQQLVSPRGVAMSAVIDSKNFNGNTFVIAQYVDGNRYLFYNGVIVNQSWIGVVQLGQEDFGHLSTQLAQEINQIAGGWSAVANTDTLGVASVGSTIVKSPSGVTFNSVDTHQSNPANFAVYGSVNMHDALPTGTAEVHAIAAFQVQGTVFGNGTFSLTAPANSNGTGVAVLTGPAALNVGHTDQQTATIIANAINNLTVIHGYTALTDSNADVFVLAPTGWGAAANGFVLTITTTGAATWAPSALSNFLPTLTIDPSPLIDIGRTRGDALFSATATARVKGGLSPYTFQWSEISTVPSGITLGNETTQVAYFSRIMPGPLTIISGTFKCVITDSQGHSATAKVVVTFESQF